MVYKVYHTYMKFVYFTKTTSMQLVKRVVQAIYVFHTHIRIYMSVYTSVDKLTPAIDTQTFDTLQVMCFMEIQFPIYDLMF